MGGCTKLAQKVYRKFRFQENVKQGKLEQKSSEISLTSGSQEELKEFHEYVCDSEISNEDLRNYLKNLMEN